MAKSLKCEFKRQIRLTQYNENNFKKKARALVEKFPHKLNYLDFKFLQDAIIEPDYHKELKFPLYKDDSSDYLEGRCIHEFDMCRFFKGGFQSSKYAKLP